LADYPQGPYDEIDPDGDMVIVDGEWRSWPEGISVR
jgi:hypothetical protein